MILTRPCITVEDGTGTHVENPIPLTGARTKRRVVPLALRRLIPRSGPGASLWIGLGLALVLILPEVPTYGAAPDTTRPTVSWTVPANSATGVPIGET